jgi:WD40-like Beta Propeller Repeat
MALLPTAVERIDGWKEIARYLGRDVTTAIRWERQKGLPVHRVPGGKRQPVFCYVHEIEEWLGRGRADLSGVYEGPLPVNEPPTVETESNVPAEAIVPGGEGSSRSLEFGVRSWQLTLAVAAGVLLVVAVLSWILWPRTIQLKSESQITNDGAIKTHLVTDGRNVYVGEFRDGRVVLAVASVDGGPTHEIPTPFIQTVPVAISGNGRQLLALVGEGEEHEKALWVIPMNGAAPRRIGNFLCHAATWTQDERQIAYSFGNAVYLAGPDGSTSRELYTFTTIPEELRWSLDGRRLIVRLRDSSTWDSTIWELVLRFDHLALTTIRPLVTTPGDYDSISPVLDSGDDFFLGTGGEPSSVFSVRQPRLPWTAGAILERFAGESTQASDFALDRANRRLYVLKDTAARTELNWFDGRSREFHLFLPGLSVRDVDFSRDGRSIAYIKESDNSLWVAASDGTSPRRIATPGMVNIELPRWSPDGKRIAFMGKLAEAPYRIFVASAAGDGAPVPASHGSDNQGAPTWSTDGCFARKSETAQFRRLISRPANRFRSQDQKVSPLRDGRRMAVSSRPFVRTSMKSGFSIGGPECGESWPTE